MKRKSGTILSEEKKAEIIDYFKNNKENQSSKIAIIFDTPIGTVNHVIDKYIYKLMVKTEIQSNN